MHDGETPFVAVRRDLPSRKLRSVLAFAEAFIPGSRSTRGADEATVTRLLEVLDSLPPRAVGAFGTACVLLDEGARLRAGNAFYALSRPEQERLLAACEKSHLFRAPFYVLGLLLKAAHFDVRSPARAPERQLPMTSSQLPSWESRIVAAADWTGGDCIECDVVVVGTGAGGAVVGSELARAGHAVVFVEEGRRHAREDLGQSLVHAQKTLFRTAFALGASPIPLQMGRMVGGSTAVNGGTCIPTPDFILDRWCEELQSDDFSPQNMATRFDRVRQQLIVDEPERRFIGPIADVMDRGAQALGWHTSAIARNAVGCEGAGFCGLGCASGARRGTDASYLPGAIERGALVLSEARADRVLIEQGRAVGIEVEDARGRRLSVRGRAVVFAGGAIPTPMFLLKRGLANSSRQVGRNLSLHPSSAVAAYFDEALDPDRYIPQGYMMDEFLREGILLLAAQPAHEVAHTLFPFAGQRFMRAMDSLSHLAMFGAVIRDQTRGRVWTDFRGHPLITYNLVPADVALMKRAMVLAGEMCLAAGARRLQFGVLGADPIDTREQFERFKQRKLRASELALISYHPLGTCRMGRDSRTSVVDLDHEAHDLKGFYIVDGSTVPGPPGVNPQLTIMALAVRAAERIAARLA